MTIYKLLQLKVDLNWVFKKLTSYSDLWMYRFTFTSLASYFALLSLFSLSKYIYSHITAA